MNHDNTMIDINVMLDNAEPPLNADCCIYKVPFRIRRLNEDTYTPKVISIGPFHHRHNHHPHLQNMERHKLIYCKTFLEHTKTTTQPLIDYIDSILFKFRRCYSETLDFTDKELVKLILIDSVFIIQLFCMEDWYQDDAFLLKPWLVYDIMSDLLLLENQLPFFVLENIFNISITAKTDIPSFLELAFDFFDDCNKSNLVSENSDISIRHFTDLIRIFHLQHPLETRPRRTREPIEHLHSVTELFEAGVRFKVNTESKCLLDMKFSGGVLEIPQLRVEDWTETLFRNMVALEICHYPFESYITDYVVALDFLINTGRDVDILVQNGIFINWLGDSDYVANMINSLWKNVTQANFSSHYSLLFKDLDGFYNDPLHNLKATLRRDYCSNPWKTAATVAGILLLILSLIQAVCSVLQVIPQ